MYVRPIKVDDLLMKKFIKDRLNKDNLWNLVFVGGVALSAGITQLLELLSVPNFVALFCLVATITIVPYFLAKQNAVLYKKKKFISKTGRDLTKNLPKYKHFFLVMVLTVPFSVQSFFFIKDNLRLLNDVLCVYTTVILFLPISYSIIINCPFSIFFNKNLWYRFGKETAGFSNDNYSSSNYSKSLLSLSQLRNNPINKWHSTNIYRRK